MPLSLLYFLKVKSSVATTTSRDGVYLHTCGPYSGHLPMGSQNPSSKLPPRDEGVMSHSGGEKPALQWQLFRLLQIHNQIQMKTEQPKGLYTYAYNLLCINRMHKLINYCGLS